MEMRFGVCNVSVFDRFSSVSVCHVVERGYRSDLVLGVEDYDMMAFACKEREECTVKS